MSTSVVDGLQSGELVQKLLSVHRFFVHLCTHVHAPFNGEVLEDACPCGPMHVESATGRTDRLLLLLLLRSSFSSSHQRPVTGLTLNKLRQTHTSVILFRFTLLSVLCLGLLILGRLFAWFVTTGCILAVS